MKQNIVINATGCALVDQILNGIDFSSASISSYLSKTIGDGGLRPGELVLKEHLEAFSGESLVQILSNISPLKIDKEKNIGGPAIIALICAAQMLEEKEVSLNFFQYRGNDKNGDYITEQLNRYVPSIGTDGYKIVDGLTPETTVLCDPSFNGGVGERTFVNTIGVANMFESDLLDDLFFEGDILLFGGTALTPSIHQDLTSLLKKGVAKRAINIVSTVYDFPNEYRSPGSTWPMGESVESYPLIDLLITDHLEALHLTGTETQEDAIAQFRSWGLPALIITNGAQDVSFYVSENSSVFLLCSETVVPTVGFVTDLIKQGDAKSGDTTGCGDNFVGGVLTFIAKQMLRNEGFVNLRDAVILGNCTGASACFYPGGMLKEKEPGEKRKKVEYILESYKNELKVLSLGQLSRF